MRGTTAAKGIPRRLRDKEENAVATGGERLAEEDGEGRGGEWETRTLKLELRTPIFGGRDSKQGGLMQPL